jgi:hypothetical protein
MSERIRRITLSEIKRVNQGLQREGLQIDMVEVTPTGCIFRTKPKDEKPSKEWAVRT